MTRCIPTEAMDSSLERCVLLGLTTLVFLQLPILYSAQQL